MRDKICAARYAAFFLRLQLFLYCKIYCILSVLNKVFETTRQNLSDNWPWSIYCICMCVVISARNERCVWIDTYISVFRGLSSARKRLFKAILKCFKCPFTQCPHLYPIIPFVQKFLARTNFPPHLQNLITLLYSDQCAPRFSSQCQSSKEIKKQEGWEGRRLTFFRCQLYVSLWLPYLCSFDHSWAWSGVWFQGYFDSSQAGRSLSDDWRSEKTGWKAEVQLREDQKRHNFNQSYCEGT